MVWKNRPTKGEEKDRERFAREAMAHLDHLYRMAFHLTKEEIEAQDLVQETFARALTFHDQFTPGTKLKAWLTRILYNFFFDNYHHKKRWISVEEKGINEEKSLSHWERVATENPGPESIFLMKELNVKILDALRRIPEEFRIPIVLVDMGDFSYAEAAETLSCPIGTVRSRLSRGRRLLHKHLKKYVEGQEGK